MDYFMPTRLYSGADCISQHADAFCALGSSCAIVTGKHAAKASGALDDVTRALEAAGVTSCLWDGVTENPPVAACAEAGRFAATNNAQFIVGIGGGSALDAAKAVAVFAANPGLDEADFYAKDWANAPLPIALVGTTAGTGSEVTKVSVLTDSAHRKHSIHDDALYAAVAFGDSRHTHTCSLSTTLSCGVDVLAHATESYFSRKADDISRAFSVRAIRLAAGPLKLAGVGGLHTAKTLVDKLLSPSHREALYNASILGGLAINTTGTCFPHNVGYYLTETHGVPHGFASAVFLPAMLERVREEDPAYAAEFYEQIGLDEDAYTSLITDFCLPIELDNISMTPDEIEAALPRWENNGSVKNTRADVTTADIREILTSLFVR